MISFAQQDLENKGDYLRLLSAVSQLSGLFSESPVPYINYRVAENIFCRSFGADNLSRSDTAFDARLGTLGVGLKTFICNKESSVEKVAEFNSLSLSLKQYNGMSLAKALANARNSRIELANSLYGLTRGLYHIVARRENRLLLFETDYSPIVVDRISLLGDRAKVLRFHDGQNEYSYNYSKSTLYRRFYIPEDAYSFPVKILEDPYQLLLELDNGVTMLNAGSDINKEYVILPLYSTSSKEKNVPEKSGLNQWNAGGRARDFGEIYIPVPRVIHRYKPDFFPPRDVSFSLETPTKEIFSAKLCQDGAKALMTNPNKALSDWLLRRLFGLREGELLTREREELLGVDSVIIYKRGDRYSIDVQPLGAYERFIGQLSDRSDL